MGYTPRVKFEQILLGRYDMYRFFDYAQNDTSTFRITQGGVTFQLVLGCHVEQARVNERVETSIEIFNS